MGSSNNHLFYPTPQHLLNSHLQWLALSKLPASPLVARPLASSSLPRLPASPPPLPVVSRSLTATSPVPSLSVRSVATRSRLSFSSESSPSSVWSVRLPRTSSPISDSSPLPSVLSRSPSSPRTSSSPAASVVSATKLDMLG